MRTSKKILALCFAITILSQLAGFAQNTVFTYQGRVLNNGTNFTGTGQFQFALVTSTNTSQIATATASAPSGGFITGYTVTSGGNGYTGATVPLVISGGGGSGAAAHANIGGGVVTSITVDNPGNGSYTSTPTVSVSSPPVNLSYTTYWSNDGMSTNGSEPLASISVGITNGLFTVVLGDATMPNMAVISASLFMQPNLQLRIWFNDGTHGFAVLSPVQNLNPAPYATMAITAQSLGAIIVQNNTNGSPNIIGGSSGNYVSPAVLGATIGGGGAVYYQNVNLVNGVWGNFGTVSGGGGNTAAAYYATVGGGELNSAIDQGATVSGGYYNVASGPHTTVGGGDYNIASGIVSVVSGGQGNMASGTYSTASGGLNNSATNYASTVPGGYGNLASELVQRLAVVITTLPAVIIVLRREPMPTPFIIIHLFGTIVSPFFLPPSAINLRFMQVAEYFWPAECEWWATLLRETFLCPKMVRIIIYP